MTQTPQEESVRQDGRDTGPDTKDLRDGARRPRRQGLPIERVFSEPGRHPYDTVTWERRDVVQSNWKTGETVFEQRGVEFPESWRVNASTIVTAKHFRGPCGTDQREAALVLDEAIGTAFGDYGIGPAVDVDVAHCLDGAGLVAGSAGIAAALPLARDPLEARGAEGGGLVCRA